MELIPQGGDIKATITLGNFASWKTASAYIIGWCLWRGHWRFQSYPTRLCGHRNDDVVYLIVDSCFPLYCLRKLSFTGTRLLRWGPMARCTSLTKSAVPLLRLMCTSSSYRSSDPVCKLEWAMKVMSLSEQYAFIWSLIDFIVWFMCGFDSSRPTYSISE